MIGLARRRAAAGHNDLDLVVHRNGIIQLNKRYGIRITNWSQSISGYLRSLLSLVELVDRSTSAYAAADIRH